MSVDTASTTPKKRDSACLNNEDHSCGIVAGTASPTAIPPSITAAEAHSDDADVEEHSSSSKANISVSQSRRPPKSPKQSLEQLNAMAAALNNEGMNAEEKQRQMGIIYSRRKRVRQKMRVDVLQTQKVDLTERNNRLRVENDRLEAILRDALAKAAIIERRAAADVWPYADSEIKAAGWAGSAGLYGGGGMLPRFGDAVGNPLYNRMHPLVPRTPAEMAYYGNPAAAMMPRPDVYSLFHNRGMPAGAMGDASLLDQRFMLLSGAPRLSAPFDAQRGYLPLDQTHP